MGDGRLVGDRKGLLLQGVNVRDPVDEGDQEVETSDQRPLVLAESLDDIRLLLGDDADPKVRQLLRRLVAAVSNNNKKNRYETMV